MFNTHNITILVWCLRINGQCFSRHGRLYFSWALLIHKDIIPPLNAFTLRTMAMFFVNNNFDLTNWCSNYKHHFWMMIFLIFQGMLNLFYNIYRAKCLEISSTVATKQNYSTNKILIDIFIKTSCIIFTRQLYPACFKCFTIRMYWLTIKRFLV